jgi:aryl-alcohol dehydrogenase-like predicted oxidoreductase
MTMLPTKTLGRTGVQLTTVGMGCAWMGHDADGNVDREAGVETILAALEGGVRFLDTAQGYMNTLSETLVGRALAAFPQRGRTSALASSRSRSCPRRTAC